MKLVGNTECYSCITTDTTYLLSTAGKNIVKFLKYFRNISRNISRKKFHEILHHYAYPVAANHSQVSVPFRTQR